MKNVLQFLCSVDSTSTNLYSPTHISRCVVITSRSFSITTHFLLQKQAYMNFLYYFFNYTCTYIAVNSPSVCKRLEEDTASTQRQLRSRGFAPESLKVLGRKQRVIWRVLVAMVVVVAVEHH